MRRAVAAAGWVVLAAGCEQPRTELVARVESEVAWGAGRTVQSVTLTVRRGGPTGPLRSARTTALGTGGERRPLPLLVGIVSADDTDTPVWIEALGCRDPNGCTVATAVVAQRAVVRFTRGQTEEVPLLLASACVGVTCGSDERCGDGGRCEPATRATVRPFAGIDSGMVMDAVVGPMDHPVIDVRGSDGPTGDIDAIETAADGAVDDEPYAAVDAPPTGQTSCRMTDIGCGQSRFEGGTFMMGDPMANRGAPVQPMITVSAFVLDQYEVTVARFRGFVNAGTPPVPSGTVMYPAPAGPQPWSGSSNAFDERSAPDGGAAFRHCNWTSRISDREGHPMNCVSWETAQAFCVWDGGRLPTEAEWEFAARGVSNRVWPWGGTEPMLPQSWVCSHRNSPLLGTCEETSEAFAMGRTPSPESVSHLIGNVWEWTADWSAEYSHKGCWGMIARVNPLCTDRDFGTRSIRGGSWDSASPSLLSSGTRAASYPPPGRYNFIGFRCAGAAR